MATTRRKRRGTKPGNLQKFGGSPASRRRDRDKDTSDKTDDLDGLVPSGLRGAFVHSKLHEKTIREAGLAEPTDPFEGDMPDLPDDIGAVDHDQLSQLMLDFQRAYSTAQWRASKAYIASDIYDEIADYLENRAVLDSDQSNDSKRKAEARTDNRVVAFRSKQKESYYDYVRFRDLGRTIEGKVKVLSRVGGFKDDDDSASDRSARAKESRGAARGSEKHRRRRGRDE